MLRGSTLRLLQSIKRLNPALVSNCNRIAHFNRINLAVPLSPSPPPLSLSSVVNLFKRIIAIRCLSLALEIKTCNQHLTFRSPICLPRERGNERTQRKGNEKGSLQFAGKRVPALIVPARPARCSIFPYLSPYVNKRLNKEPRVYAAVRRAKPIVPSSRLDFNIYP